MLIDQLQDKSKRLGESGDDPLDAARANARGAKGGIVSAHHAYLCVFFDFGLCIDVLPTSLGQAV